MKRRNLALIPAAMVFLFLWDAPAQVQNPSEAPAQPLPFSHKAHVTGQGMQCVYCHANPDPGETMNIARPSVCMECHADTKTDSPAIKRLAQYDKEKQAIPWVKVYEIPDFVNFSHRVHLQKGAQCGDCHGDAAQRDRLYREKDLTMGGCVACHKAKNASQACDFCHAEML